MAGVFRTISAVLSHELCNILYCLWVDPVAVFGVACFGCTGGPGRLLGSGFPVRQVDTARARSKTIPDQSPNRSLLAGWQNEMADDEAESRRYFRGWGAARV